MVLYMNSWLYQLSLNDGVNLILSAAPIMYILWVCPNMSIDRQQRTTNGTKLGRNIVSLNNLNIFSIFYSGMLIVDYKNQLVAIKKNDFERKQKKSSGLNDFFQWDYAK